MRSRGKILIIRGGAIGDFILTLPALAALRQQFPETHLEVLGYPHIAQIALTAGLADQVQSIEARALAPFFARNASLPEAMADYFAQFSLIISYLYDPDDFFKLNVARCTKAQFIQGPHRPVETEALHATEVFLKPLEKLAIYAAETTPRIVIPISPASRLPEGQWIAAHVGSGSERKNWPNDSWQKLLGKIMVKTDAQVLLIGGEAEEDRPNELAASLPAARVRLARNVPLAKLAELLQQCSCFLGHDSGISHLAAALGVNGLILWADTNEHIWHPGPVMKMIKDEQGLKHLPVEKVWEEIKPLLKSS